jgi:hypothetical protein
MLMQTKYYGSIIIGLYFILSNEHFFHFNNTQAPQYEHKVFGFNHVLVWGRTRHNNQGLFLVHRHYAINILKKVIKKETKALQMHRYLSFNACFTLRMLLSSNCV